MLPYADIFDNINRFLGYCAQHNVQLVLATKTIDQETLRKVHRDFPSLVFGENRQQELCEKYFPEAHWSFIGRLQRNKVKYICDKVDMICSLDSVALAQEIEKHCAKIDKTMPVLVEVNLGEEQKGGVVPDDLTVLLDAIVVCPHLSLRGLMAVLPKENAPQAAQTAQSTWLSVRDRYGLSVFSLGMSNDYQLGIQYGSTSIRIGSAVFGERSYYGKG